MHSLTFRYAHEPALRETYLCGAADPLSFVKGKLRLLIVSANYGYVKGMSNSLNILIITASFLDSIVYFLNTREYEKSGSHFPGAELCHIWNFKG